jgi:hypothetical protein
MQLPSPILDSKIDSPSPRSPHASASLPLPPPLPFPLLASPSRSSSHSPRRLDSHAWPTMVQHRSPTASLSLLLSLALSLSPAGAQKANTFAIVGNTGASAQQMFLGVSLISCLLLYSRREDRRWPGAMLTSKRSWPQSATKVYIVDKVSRVSVPP